MENALLTRNDSNSFHIKYNTVGDEVNYINRKSPKFFPYISVYKGVPVF